jgi:CubicO group peptidase (beta-lactamase class C family)
MPRNELPFTRSITRRNFLYGSVAILGGNRALRASPKLIHKKTAVNTDYSSVIEKIKQSLPVAMRLKDITGAAIALVDGENILWSEGFGYTHRSQEVKVTGDTLFHVNSIAKSLTALGVLRAVDKGLLALDDWLRAGSRSRTTVHGFSARRDTRAARNDRQHF